MTAAGRPPMSTVATATAPGGGVPMRPPWAVLSPVRAAGGMAGFLLAVKGTSGLSGFVADGRTDGRTDGDTGGRAVS
ncbi:hypothetical protein GCM10010342_10890 [Streptomyces anulatus]|nr:hypothetical protein GCM10010342_10890 [Streptomyces anulatus]